jgi:hypothetical protein
MRVSGTRADVSSSTSRTSCDLTRVSPTWGRVPNSRPAGRVRPAGRLARAPGRPPGACTRPAAWRVHPVTTATGETAPTGQPVHPVTGATAQWSPGASRDARSLPALSRPVIAVTRCTPGRSGTGSPRPPSAAPDGRPADRTGRVLRRGRLAGRRPFSPASCRLTGPPAFTSPGSREPQSVCGRPGPIGGWPALPALQQTGLAAADRRLTGAGVALHPRSVAGAATKAGCAERRTPHGADRTPPGEI